MRAWASRAAQLLAIVVGLWLMAAPSVLGYADTLASKSHRVVGPIAASLALVSMWHVTRGVRRANVVAGAWLALSPLFIAHAGAALANGVAAGVVVALLALVPSAEGPSLGGGWSALVARGAHPRAA